MISCNTTCSEAADPGSDTVNVVMEPEPPLPPPILDPAELAAEEEQRQKEYYSQWHAAKKESDRRRAEEQRKRHQEEELARKVAAEEARRAEKARREEAEAKRRAEEEAEAQRREEAERQKRVQMRKVAIQSWLINNGYSDIHTPKKTYTKIKYPLHTAAKQGNIEITEMLLEEGANRNQPDSKGRTAMDIAKNQNINSSHEGVLDVFNMAIASH